MRDVVAMIADYMNLEGRVFLTYITLIFGKRVQIKKSKKRVTDFFCDSGNCSYFRFDHVDIRAPIVFKTNLFLWKLFCKLIIIILFWH
jgi:hypothetical protein